MPKWWKIGFVSVLLVTTGALGAYVALLEPNLDEDISAQVAEYADTDYLYWDWADEAVCDLYERCQYIEIYDTARCEDQILVPMRLEDANENWVAAASTVMRSPGKQGGVLVELGVNRTDFEYFAIGDVRCTSALPTGEATL